MRLSLSLISGGIAVMSLLAACDSEVTVLAERCDVVVASADPSSGLPGDTITLTGTPFTTTWDTAVYLGNTRAEVSSVDREGCDDCDACRDDAECTACGDCDACDAACDAECVETATFVVPELAAGDYELHLINSRGASATTTFTVLPREVETGTPDDTSDSGGDSGAASDTSDSSGGADTSDSSGGADTSDSGPGAHTGASTP